MELVGFRSRHAVHRLIERLIAGGLVSKAPQGTLIPHPTQNGVLLRGTMEARWPSPAEEELKDTIMDQRAHLNRESHTFGKAGGLIGTPSKGATNQGPPEGGCLPVPRARRLV